MTSSASRTTVSMGHVNGLRYTGSSSTGYSTSNTVFYILKDNPDVESLRLRPELLNYVRLKVQRHTSSVTSTIRTAKHGIRFCAHGLGSCFCRKATLLAMFSKFTPRLAAPQHQTHPFTGHCTRSSDRVQTVF